MGTAKNKKELPALGAGGGVQARTILRTTVNLQRLNPPFQCFDIKKFVFGPLPSKFITYVSLFKWISTFPISTDNRKERDGRLEDFKLQKSSGL